MKAAAMAHPHHHALSSVKKWGGDVSDYIPLHEFFDQSKSHMADFRHRAYRHHALGIFQLEQQFGRTITLSTGRVIPTRWVGEQHVKEDLGRIPTLADWLRCIRAEDVYKRQTQKPCGPMGPHIMSPLKSGPPPSSARLNEKRRALDHSCRSRADVASWFIAFG